jgi:hypothetical protein
VVAVGTGKDQHAEFHGISVAMPSTLGCCFEC